MTKPLWLNNEEIGELYTFMDDNRTKWEDSEILKGVFTMLSELQWKSGQ